MSSITRESACELTANAMREGMFALIKPGDDVDRRPLRRDDQVNAGRARELRQAHDRRFDLRRRDQHEVGELVDDDHDVG